MDNASKKDPEDQGLSPVIDRFERIAVDFIRENPSAVSSFLVFTILLILSPLLVFWLIDLGKGKDWSEVVKNVVESGAVFAAVFVIMKWVNERRDRATDVLLKLEEQFQLSEINAGKDVLVAGDFKGTQDEINKLDALLRFFVVLYGVLLAKQVPEKSLSICFRYFLAFYFRADRTEFRKFVDEHYPTLRMWLRSDARQNCRFFTPGRLFPLQLDREFIDQCARENTT